MFRLLLTLLLTVSAHSAYAHTVGAHVVELRDDGFQPSVVEIEAGETAIFENRGENSHWPASDIHPTHQIYPTFDPQREIPPGSSWSFTFEKAGTWKMHDHLFPELRGTIVVKGSERPLEEDAAVELWGAKITRISHMLVQTFLRWYYELLPQKLTQKFEELNMMEVAKDEGAVRSWLQMIGPEKAMAELLRDSGGGSTIDCHQQAHTLGRIAYALFGADAFQKGNAACHSGFYHGAMETLLQQEGTEELAPKIAALCGKFSTQFGIFECLHGVGHGVLAYENYDLPKALRTCAELTTDYDRSSCYGGLFMENIVTAQGLGARPTHATTWVSADPHFPCNGIDQNASIQHQCYLMQTSRMLQVTHYDFERVAEECTRAPASLVSVCFRSLGRDIAGYTLRNPPEIGKRCAKVIEAHQDDCITGAVNVIVDFWGGGLTDQATTLCQLLPNNRKRNCYSILAGRLLDIFGNDEERKQACDRFERDYQYLCSPCRGTH